MSPGGTLRAASLDNARPLQRASSALACSRPLEAMLAAQRGGCGIGMRPRRSGTFKVSFAGKC